MKIWPIKRREMSPSIQKFADLLDEHEREENKKPYMERNLFPPATDPQLVVDCLCELFLEPDWYVIDPITTGQVNTVILDQILQKHCRAYRKDTKRRLKASR